MHTPTNAQKVLQKFKAIFPKENLSPTDLECAPKNGHLWFIPPPSIYDEDPHHPPFLALRFDQFFKRASHEDEILNVWETLKAAGVKFPKSNKPRLSTLALHMGIWQWYNNIPYISSDTLHQRPLVLHKMDDFLSLVKKYVAPRILDFLQDEFPETYEWNQRFLLLFLKIYYQDRKSVV